ncbi:hypothetical protein BKD30_04225 [Tersicoccus phoenicis]|uniref:Type II secretion system protein GspF domain-containing protein n=1 Tax=Tersicoccus phoenicis TaxID=554083 RepID=A0A1R1LHI2_9MICC|nr:hypothetical protein [Tersicoccus phoenicis]OMH26962.1 hypothetical protein BKD30_04225 [Tersicoccus phoenicis]
MGRAAVTGVLVALLLATAATLAMVPVTASGQGSPLERVGRPDQGPVPSAGLARRRRRRRARTADLDDQVRTLRQLSALLAAGRPLTSVWSEVLAGRWAASALSTEVKAEAEAGTAAGPVDRMLRAAARDARWGRDPTEALRDTRRLEGPERDPGDRAVRRAMADGWAGLADCIDIARATGAPLASLLDRFAAAQADARDADAARAAALAGPAVTVRILRWLPVAGLGLGVLMGADPVRVLTTTPVGWVLVALAAGLMLLGHLWVRRLLAVAAG